MKKLMSLLLAAMLVLGLAACGGQAGGAPDTNQPENSTTPVSDESTPSGNPTTPAAPETITITSREQINEIGRAFSTASVTNCSCRMLTTTSSWVLNASCICGASR